MARASIDLKQKIVNIQQFSNDTDTIDFYFDRFTNSGIDLASLEAWIIFDTIDVIVSNIDNTLVKTETETQIKLSWTINSLITNEENVIPFQIVFTDNKDIKMYTTCGKVKVNKTIGIEDIIVPSNLTVFQQWEKRMKELADIVVNGGGGGGTGGGGGGNIEIESITDIQTLYSKNDSDEIAPTDGWDSEKPEWERGTYIWQKIVITYINGSTRESKPVCIIGSENELILNKVDFFENVTNENIEDLKKLLKQLQDDSISIENLDVHLANIDVAKIGDLFAESLTAFTAAVSEATINDAYIKDLVASSITVADLKAANTLANRVVIVGSDSSPAIAFENSTQQFYDANGNVRVQIGQDGNGDFNFIVRGEDGTTALFDENGITKDAVPDNTIVDNMIENNTISKDKINFPIIEPNEHGGVDITQIYDGEEKFGVEYTSFKEGIISKVDTLTKSTQLVTLIGQQVFVKTDEEITPSSITLTAITKNNAEISKWYIDDIENTSYVTEDKRQIVIPNTLMTDDKNTLNIKVECTDSDVYDLMTIYKVTDGNDGYMVAISSSNGLLFKSDEDNYETETTCTCTVYKGVREITPKTYNWLYIEENGTDWVSIGNTKTITIPITSNIIKKRLKCQVEV